MNEQKTYGKDEVVNQLEALIGMVSNWRPHPYQGIKNAAGQNFSHKQQMQRCTNDRVFLA